MVVSWATRRRAVSPPPPPTVGTMRRAGTAATKARSSRKLLCSLYGTPYSTCLSLPPSLPLFLCRTLSLSLSICLSVSLFLPPPLSLSPSLSEGWR